ncbi:sensor histidine kinase [Deinococcus cellulosilyticus]|uniref:histidine kinase n=1 Tax=Deinococcus cellulosilyticus (strain DSM 18568 / NBRC 106333 / KACC 11606 / 5516J-15) TaxID=1223518 RepID=A0A511MYG2_DEIC1|nr:ATP-binding protein [Deinococcus cellulosilyticus]GEM45599.1 hypothetical protein DC3_12340 [Deinococcus cellulosilyticus NBRC 106333 = KACC 11606]
MDACAVCRDPDRLKQLLVILTSNAIKYTPDGGSVSFRLRSRNGKAELCIRDTGVGIAAEELGRVFERHYRAKQEGLTDPGGSGLGLSLAKWIVEEHKGEILLESTVGVGTEVRVRLPLLIK